MAFKLVSAINLRVLAEELSGNLYNGVVGILDSPKIVVQSKGMQRWLSLQLAENNGIAAGIDFLFLNGLFEEVVYAPCKADLGYTDSLVSREQLKWLIFKLLDNIGGDRIFTIISRYIDNDRLKQLQIAEKIAGIYDMYSLYRPDWLLAWENGEVAAQEVNRKEEKWLAELWRMVKEKSEFCSFAELSEVAMQWLKEEKGIAEQLPPAIHVFGVSSISPRFLAMLDLLAQKTDIYFYYLEVSTEYWGLVRSEKDILRREGSNYEVGNTLLAALGQRNRDFFNLLVEYTSNYGVIEERREEDSSVRASTPLLARIQHDIRKMQNPKSVVCIGDADRSILFHSCYGNMRQVEALRQSLLQEFQQDKELKPKDILVLTSDIKSFVPYIKAVFGTVDYNSPEYIPFTVSDRAVIDENKTGRLLLNILKIFTGRFKVSEVWGVFVEFAALQGERVTEENKEVIVEWLSELAVHWGIDGEQREKICGVFYEESSWKEAEERLLFGYACSAAEELSFTFDSGREISGVEVAGGISELDIWLSFITDLFDLYKSFLRLKSIEEWFKFINLILSRITAENEKEVDEIRSNIEEFKDIFASLSMQNEKIEADLFIGELEKALTDTMSSTGFIMGGVTFCQFQPMRNIPAKVICMLGMDDGGFPRISRPVSFDISQQERRLCDPSLKLDDQGVFLETVLSVSDKLQVFYNGNSLQDGVELPASLPVKLLQDYIGEFYCYQDNSAVLEKIKINHPLQSFSEEYFADIDGLEGVENYSLKDYDIYSSMRGNLNSIVNDSGGAGDVVLCRDLITSDILDYVAVINMYINPARVFLQQSCGVRYSWLEDELPDDDDAFDFEKGYLKNKYLDEILTMRMQGLGEGEIQKRVLLDRNFPVADFGKDKFEECYRLTGSLYQVLQPFFTGEKEEVSGERTFLLGVDDVEDVRVQINYELESLVVKDGVAYNIDYSFTKISWRNVCKLWLEHLLYSLLLEDGVELESILYDSEGKEKFKYTRVSADKVDKLLSQYIEGYYLGLQDPLPVFKGASSEYAVSYLADQDADVALARAVKKYIAGRYGGDAADKYVYRCYGDDFSSNSGCLAGFERAALKYVLPAYEAKAGKRISRRKK